MEKELEKKYKKLILYKVTKLLHVDKKQKSNEIPKVKDWTN